jgi:hypothetical protein
VVDIEQVLFYLLANTIICNLYPTRKKQNAFNLDWKILRWSSAPGEHDELYLLDLFEVSQWSYEMDILLLPPVPAKNEVVKIRKYIMLLCKEYIFRLHLHWRGNIHGDWLKIGYDKDYDWLVKLYYCETNSKKCYWENSKDNLIEQ